MKRLKWYVLLAIGAALAYWLFPRTGKAATKFTFYEPFETIRPGAPETIVSGAAKGEDRNSDIGQACADLFPNDKAAEIDCLVARSGAAINSFGDGS